MSLSAFLEHRSRRFWWLVAPSMVVLLGLIDDVTGYDYSFSQFYLAPIALATWYADRNLGLAIAGASGITWLAADILSGHAYSNPVVYLWNTLMRFGIYVTVVLLLDALRQALRQQAALARTDFLTGTVNSRAFHESLSAEVERARRYRHPLTLAYIDLDNFKTVNDRHGHAVGDDVLRCVGRALRQNTRVMDVVARLGGDEFAVLLPEVDAAAARTTGTKLHAALQAAMQPLGWPVGFSVGVVTFRAPPDAAEEVIRAADRQMYAAKTQGKDRVNAAELPEG
jgi:diguanylate cyclase (GGDEF)-like protein